MEITFYTGETIDIKVGTKVYMKNCNTKSDTLIELVASKIGRKWITFKYENYTSYQFDKDAYENSDYCHNILYPSQDRYNELIEYDALFFEIRDMFHGRVSRQYTLKQLYDVINILKPNETE